MQKDPFHDIIHHPTADDIYFLDHQLDDLHKLSKKGDEFAVAGGPILAWWGTCNAAAGLWNGLDMLDIVPAAPVTIYNFVAGLLGSVLVMKLTRSDTILRHWRNQVVAWTWIMVAMAIPLIVAGSFARGTLDNFVISGIEAALFAMAFVVTAISSHRRWLIWVSAGWWLSAAAFFFLVGPTQRPFLFCGASLVLMTAPGVYLSVLFYRTRI